MSVVVFMCVTAPLQSTVIIADDSALFVRSVPGVFIHMVAERTSP